MPLLDPHLKDILICPHCHGDLEEDDSQAKLRRTGCGLAFPVRDGIPVMLIDEAEKPDGFDIRDSERAAQDADKKASGGVA